MRIFSYFRKFVGVFHAAVVKLVEHLSGRKDLLRELLKIPTVLHPDKIIGIFQFRLLKTGLGMGFPCSWTWSVIC